jgi:hypothetical protein
MYNQARYLVVDGGLSGTGIRDAVEGGYLTVSAIGISEDLINAISSWQQRYELTHFGAY